MYKNSKIELILGSAGVNLMAVIGDDNNVTFSQVVESILSDVMLGELVEHLDKLELIPSSEV